MGIPDGGKDIPVSPWRDGWSLALGTLTALPTRAPRTVDARSAARAAVLAPLAFLPMGLLVVAICRLAAYAGLPALATGFGVVATLALGTRALHWDGLADVADGLTASYDRERSLAVMQSGSTGPAGTVVVVLVAGLQAAGVAGILGRTAAWPGAVTIAVVACLARWALLLACVHGVPSARPGGLGAAFAGSVPRTLAAGGWVVAAALLGLVATWADYSWWRGPLAAALALVAVVVVVLRAVRRLGGVTGDVLGGAIELASAVMLVALSA